MVGWACICAWVHTNVCVYMYVTCRPFTCRRLYTPLHMSKAGKYILILGNSISSKKQLPIFDKDWNKTHYYLPMTNITFTFFRASLASVEKKNDRLFFIWNVTFLIYTILVIHAYYMQCNCIYLYNQNFIWHKKVPCSKKIQMHSRSFLIKVTDDL